MHIMHQVKYQLSSKTEVIIRQENNGEDVYIIITVDQLEKIYDDIMADYEALKG